MYTVVETPTFQRYAATVWTGAEREEFIDWIAAHPEAGAVIPGTGGLRKVRWARQGMGKRGGARIIYFNPLDNGLIVLLIVYTKAKFDNLPTAVLNQLRGEASDG
ncbi:hypothetical protein SAMN02949497_1948 [Methylomagnum ishizawai]|uniref:Uncharacterized protein n=1 Tax=Methylomagnum ishizawai TaxID=1760988 RepID=A0A1Y6CWB6_9GAMM|nr:transcriptional regulator [Methylomagnum ishizawai]SMF94627.1 hypothetical protein SAMN02949497_1948 [Methylomagnum ishizawai]